MLDDFDQKYTVFNHIQEFRKIPDITETLFRQSQNKISSWKLAGEICNFVNNLSEELVDAENLIADTSAEISTVGQILKLYQEILTENNLLELGNNFNPNLSLYLLHFPTIRKLPLSHQSKYLQFRENFYL